MRVIDKNTSVETFNIHVFEQGILNTIQDLQKQVSLMSTQPSTQESVDAGVLSRESIAMACKFAKSISGHRQSETRTLAASW